MTDPEPTLTNRQSADGGQPRYTSVRLWKRPLFVGAVLAAVVLLLVAATWILAGVFQSPAQREANASPPPPQPVFAAVTTGTLADQRSYSGTIVYSNETGVTLPPAANATLSVVTGGAAAVGGTCVSGEVLTEVNTRPIFIVQSPFDFFRDIGVGDAGADVRALQDALVDRGYLEGADGTYGEQTARAVERWYEDAGYHAPTRPRPSSGASPTSPGASGGSESSTSADSPGSSSGSGSGSPSAGGSSNSNQGLMLDPYVPVGELLAYTSLPATIVAAPAVGTHVGRDGATDFTFGTSPLMVRAEVPEAETKGIIVGESVTVRTEAGEADAIVTTIEAQSPDEKGKARPSVVSARFGSGSTELASERGGTATMQVQSAVIARDSLIVPTAAVVGRGEGRGVVVKRQKDGSLVEVPVAVAGSLRGMTAIAPDATGALVEGDDIRVG